MPDQGRNLCPHPEGRVGMEFQISTSSPLIILLRRGAWPPWTPLWEDDSEISDHPGGLLGYHCNREGQGMSLVPTEDENLGSSTLDFLIPPLFLPHPDREGDLGRFVEPFETRSLVSSWAFSG